MLKDLYVSVLVRVEGVIIFSLLQAIPSEIQCGECTSRVLEAMGKMINLIRKQTRQGDVTPIDTGRNILNVLSIKFP